MPTLDQPIQTRSFWSAWSPTLAWLRAIFAAAFGGAADGILIGLGGAGGTSVVTGQPVNLTAIKAAVLVNILIDTARFVKANPDPFGYIPPAGPAIVQVPLPASQPKTALEVATALETISNRTT